MAPAQRGDRDRCHRRPHAARRHHLGL